MLHTLLIKNNLGGFFNDSVPCLRFQRHFQVQSKIGRRQSLSPATTGCSQAASDGTIIMAGVRYDLWQKVIERLQDLDIRLLRVFWAVSRCGGFTAAQVELNTSQSTISTQMAELESRLGMRLCERGKSGFRLTQNGRAVVDALPRLFTSLDNFRNSVNECSEILRGELRFGLNDIMISNPNCQLSRAFGRFYEEAPNVQIDLFVGETSELESRLLDNRLHLAVGIFHQQLSTLEFQRLFTEDHLLYCSADHPICSIPNDKLTIEAVRDFDYIGWDYLESLEALRPVVELNNTSGTPYMEGIAMMVCSGRYIAYLPTHYANQWVQNGRMRPILPGETIRTVDVHLATRKDLQHNRLVQRFTKHIRESHANMGE